MSSNIESKDPIRFRAKGVACVLLSALLLPASAQSVAGVTGPNYLTPALVSVFFMIVLNGLFVAAETSLELLRPSHAKGHDGQGGESRVLQDLLDCRSQYSAACILGSQTMRALMIVACFFAGPAIAQWLAIGSAENSWGANMIGGVLLSIPVVGLNVILAELVPKSYSVLHPAGTASRLAKFIQIFSLLFSIPSRALIVLANLVTRRFGARASFAFLNQAEDEIKSIVESAQETGEIEQVEKDLLHSVFEFTDTVAREIMTPRVDMDALAITADPDEVIRLIDESGHSRIPLYEDTDDHIVGIVLAKDLLMAKHSGDDDLRLRKLMRPVLFVPENKNLHELLRDMRVGRSQMAIVQDEFGGTAGIVTIEDIVEELVGEIVDEYDVEEPEIVPNGSGWIVEGKVNLYDLNGEIGSSIQSEEFDTVGGYVFGLFGRQPKQTEEIESDGYKFIVEETDGRRIVRLHVEHLPDAEQDEDPESVT